MQYTSNVGRILLPALLLLAPAAQAQAPAPPPAPALSAPEAQAVLDAPAAARWLARTLGAPPEIIRPVTQNQE